MVGKIKNYLQGSIIKPGPTHKVKTIKRATNWTDQTTDMSQKSRTHVFKFFTIYGENCESSRVQ